MCVMLFTTDSPPGHGAMLAAVANSLCDRIIAGPFRHQGVASLFDQVKHVERTIFPPTACDWPSRDSLRRRCVLHRRKRLPRIRLRRSQCAMPPRLDRRAPSRALSAAGHPGLGAERMFGSWAAPRSDELPMNPVVLVCGADDGFARPLAVTLYSALRNYRGSAPVQVHIVDGGISSANRAR